LGADAERYNMRLYMTKQHQQLQAATGMGM
jgi:hypothetical protein